MNVDDFFKKPDFLKKYGNNILLNTKEYNILKKYNIDPNKYNNNKSLIFDIEKILEDENIEELDQVLMDISERDYYSNTNK